ncbi:MAG: tRNA (adenosine(37)-N6)-dimethylallyltransferase MiaA, partial [Gemmatimonadetes bacterium]|nr:tRNA (adenosine(37)-N6)-dimethylallyltransferase MiaA [Gemmatimonadota bacterium]NIY08418.1 tRNA (adenosine(37)-N6)-dimethylallyltransferase MiaA [Gemmatimonadota bacterium]
MGSPARDTRPPVVVVTGPTAAGKTPLAIELALRFDGEIVNADSMQVYRYMDIGTAKPTPEQRARVPHHLLDVVTPDVPYDAGRYAREARAAARAIHERGRTVFLTGGTGLYIRAFLEGLVEAGGADPELRQTLEREHARAIAAGRSTLLY